MLGSIVVLGSMLREGSIAARMAPASIAWTAVIVLGSTALPGCAPDPHVTAWRAGLGASEERSPDAEAQLHPVRIHEPPELTTIALTEDAPGVGCATCHGPGRIEPAMPNIDDDARGPHAGLRFEHGTNACRSCHAEGDVTALHLADGRTIEMREAMTLCAQCHGSQFRDYQHGSHGGMRGYWDRSRGERQRNHCVDCHDPHAPAYPSYLPMPAPRDRVRPVGAHHASASEEASEEASAETPEESPEGAPSHE